MRINQNHMSKNKRRKQAKWRGTGRMCSEASWQNTDANSNRWAVLTLLSGLYITADICSWASLLTLWWSVCLSRSGHCSYCVNIYSTCEKSACQKKACCIIFLFIWCNISHKWQLFVESFEKQLFALFPPEETNGRKTNMSKTTVVVFLPKVRLQT